jgi:hypothetical protein
MAETQAPETLAGRDRVSPGGMAVVKKHSFWNHWLKGRGSRRVPQVRMRGATCLVMCQSICGKTFIADLLVPPPPPEGKEAEEVTGFLREFASTRLESEPAGEVKGAAQEWRMAEPW